MNKKSIYSSSTDLQELALKALSDLTPLFLEHMAADIQSMHSFLKQAKSATPEKRFTLICDSFFRKAHDMKGEGTTFDYPLLTFLGTVMCDHLRYKTTITSADLKFLTDCLMDVQMVFDQKITGEGNSFGQKLRQKWGKK